MDRRAFLRTLPGMGVLAVPALTLGRGRERGETFPELDEFLADHIGHPGDAELEWVGTCNYDGFQRIKRLAGASRVYQDPDKGRYLIYRGPGRRGLRIWSLSSRRAHLHFRWNWLALQGRHRGQEYFHVWYHFTWGKGPVH